MDSSLASASTLSRVEGSTRSQVKGSEKSPRVLVVDDESRIRLALRACLEAEGYLVTEAADGVEALESVRSDIPDLIILDLAMPRLNGLAAIRQLKTMFGAQMPRIIVLTAYGSTHSESFARESGVCAFLEKPLLPDALRRVVEEVLHHPAATLQAQQA